MEQEFLNSIYFKSIILGFDREELIENLNLHDNPLEVFMTLLSDTAKWDSSFFALDDEILDKILYVVNKYRFNNIDSESFEMINDVIRFCNEVRNFSEEDKDKIYIDYVRRQSMERHKLIYYQDDLFAAIGMDALVYEAVKNNEVDNPYVRNSIVPSTHYFLHNCFPIVLDKEYYNNLKNILMDDNILSKKDKRSGKKILKTMKKIDNII